jgi:hypothetical protein
MGSVLGVMPIIGIKINNKEPTALIKESAWLLS